MPTDSNEPQQLTGIPRLWRATRPYRQRLDEYSALIVLVLALTTLLSAGIGIAIATPSGIADEERIRNPPSLWNRFTDAIYEAAQVTALNMDPHNEDFNFFIGLARITSVCLAIVVAYKAIQRLFKDSIEHLRMRFWGDRLVFIAGMGRIGLEVARMRAAKNQFVVGLEIADANHSTVKAEENGVLVKHGDVNHAAFLEAIVAKNPSEYFLVTGDDQTNINALARVRALRHELRETKPDKVGQCECYVHIEDAILYGTLCRTLAEQQREIIRDEGLTVRYFNLAHESACELIVNDLTRLRPEANGVPLYIVFGFEQMGQVMVKELAEFAHFENQCRARILVLTDDPSRDADRCLARWPRMSPRIVRDRLSDVRFAPASDEWKDRSVRLSAPYDVAVKHAVEYAANVCFCKLDCLGVLTQRDVAEIVRLASPEVIPEAGVTDEAANGATKSREVCPVAIFCYENDDLNFKMANGFTDLLSDYHGINRVRATASVAPRSK